MHTFLFKFFILFTFSLSAYALTLNSKNFKADFKQIVSDENKKEITYSGKLYAKYPNLSFWQYTTPIEKDIYINNRVVTIVEPDLEQVIIQNMENEIDLLTILKNAEEIEKDNFVTTFGGVKYTILMSGNLLKQINYKDKFENSVKIIFNNANSKVNIEESLFTATYPDDFDVISH